MLFKVVGKGVEWLILERRKGLYLKWNEIRMDVELKGMKEGEEVLAE